MSDNRFIFRNHQSIGAADAEQDEKYLSDCFVDTGVLEILRDCEEHRCILLGRTGSGKSALISKIRDDFDNVIQIHPDSLSLTYIANSNVINFLSNLNVNLNLFYCLLWRHVFIIEILKQRFAIEHEESFKHFLQKIWNTVTRNKKNQMAFDYLKEWGESFWLETESRVREITHKLEKDIKSTFVPNIPGIGQLDLSLQKKLTDDQKEEIVYRSQEIVNKVQIKDLNIIIEFLDDILRSNRQKKYYIIIDKLDEDWIENKLRFQLIRALIDSGLKMNNMIDNVKVIIALRADLLDRVYQFTRGTGFQEEKYNSNCFNLKWSEPNLVEVLDRRIDKLVRSQYTKQKVTHKDLIRPVHINNKKMEAIDYMLERTLLRPRDIIQFFNICINLSDGKPKIDNNTLFDSEGQYSRDRFRALIDEWIGIYPNLEATAQILRKKNKNFKIEDLKTKEIEEHCLHILTLPEVRNGDDRKDMEMLLDGKIKPEEYRKRLVLMFYKVSLVGLKPNEAISSVSWSYSAGSSISEAEIDNSSRVYIQKTFWKHFGITNFTI